MKVFAIPTMIVLLLSGCSTNVQPALMDEEEILEVTYVSTEELEIITSNLNIPWSIAKHGETFYITERPGNIVKIEQGKMERQRVELEKKLATAAEAGLLGFILAPDFQQSNLAYAYYTYVDGVGQFNRIVTLRLEDSVWKEVSVLLDRIPSGRFHHGGRLKIGPDDKLYATAGDALQSTIAQDLNSLGGKILRLNLDGSIPSDNPYQDSYVYSYGHRNPQGLAWSSNGSLYASEHGNDANDEINKIEAGQNYGWPIIEGIEKGDGMIAPLFTSGSNATWAPSGMEYRDGKLYVATLRGEAVLEFNLETEEQEELITGLGRIRDVLIIDDTLYFVTNNTDGRGDRLENDDKLYRIILE